jgi:ATP-binding cassette, subfamily B, bacterial PglK
MFIKKGLSILDSSSKIKIYFLIFSSLISSILEVIGIGLAIPMVALITSQEISQNYEALNFFLSFLDNFSQFEKIKLVLFLFFFIFVIKNFYLLFQIFIQSKILQEIELTLSKKLLSKYFSMPYLSLKKRKSSELIRNLIAETSAYAKNFINPLIIILVESIILISIISLLITYHFKIVFVVSVSIIFISFIFYIFFKNKNILFGSLKQKYDSIRIKTIQESFGAYKEIKINNKESFFINLFSTINKKTLDASRYQFILNNIPRLAMEIIAIFTFCLLIFFSMKSENYNFVTILPTIAFFLTAIIRMLPSINKIQVAFQSIKFSQPSVNLVLTEMSEINKIERKEDNHYKIKFDNSIIFENLSFEYEDNAHNKVLDRLNIKINKNQFIGVYGKTGSGKSTLLNILIGLITPTSGSIKIDENIYEKKFFNSWLTNISYVPQNIFLFDDTIKKNITLHFDDSRFDQELFKKVIKITQLENFIESLPLKENTIIGEQNSKISGGQAQRIAIARAMYNKKNILILDEATSSLDEKTEQLIIEELKKNMKDMTIIFVTHRTKNLQYCDQVINL